MSSTEQRLSTGTEWVDDDRPTRAEAEWEAAVDRGEIVPGVAWPIFRRPARPCAECASGEDR